MVIDEQVLPLQRIWCLFEVYHTIRLSQSNHFEGGSVAAEIQKFHDLCLIALGMGQFDPNCTTWINME